MATKKTQTTVRTGTLTERRTGERTLTRDEELVVRMTRGLSEGADHRLEFRGGTHADVRARLALMEAHLLSEMHADTGSDIDVDEGLKSRIVDRLAALDD